MTAKLFIFPAPEPEPEPPTRKRKRRRQSAEIATFPRHRTVEAAKDHARVMRGISGARDRERYLTRVFEDVCTELAALGIDCRDCQSAELHRFAEAIGRQLLGRRFMLQDDRVALQDEQVAR